MKSASVLRALTVGIACATCACSDAALADAGAPDAEAGPGEPPADSGGGIDSTADGRADAPLDSSLPDAQDGAGKDAATAALLSLTVSTGTLVPAFDPAVTDYQVTSLNSVYPIEVTATTSDASAPLLIHGAAATSGVPAIFKLERWRRLRREPWAGARTPCTTCRRTCRRTR